MSNPVGRPSKYRPEYCDDIVKYMAQGNTFVQFAAEIGVDYETLLAWSKKHPEFNGAKKKAEKATQSFWERVLRQASLGIPMKVNNETLKPNTTLIIFLMKCRFRDTYGEQVALTGDFDFVPLKSFE